MTALDVTKTDSQKAQLYRFALRQILKLEDKEEVEDGGSIETPEDGPIDWSAEIEETEVLDLFELMVEMDLADESGSAFQRESGHIEKLYVYRTGWYDSFDRETLKTDKQDALRNERQNPR